MHSYAEFANRRQSQDSDGMGGGGFSGRHKRDVAAFHCQFDKCRPEGGINSLGGIICRGNFEKHF